MYICSCRAVTDGQIRRAVENGCSTWKELVHLTEVCTQCGKCGLYAKEIFDTAKKLKDAPAPICEQSGCCGQRNCCQSTKPDSGKDATFEDE